MSQSLLLLITIPSITAFVGWVTNWAAVKMIFHPVRFMGIGRFGWQAIVIRHAPKFATGIAEMALRNLITVSELAERIQTKELVDRVAAHLDSVAGDLCKQIAEIVKPGAWGGLPDHVRGMAVAQFKTRSRALTSEIVDQLKTRAKEFVNLRKLIFASLSGENAMTLHRLTRRIGKKEFKFIEYYGGVFGFFVGLVQVAVWTVMQTWWLMPIVGIAVGLMTNWLAIKMIFRPHEPTRYLGILRYQGLFPKRQREIARDYGEVSATDVLSAQNLMNSILHGPAREKIVGLIESSVAERIDAEWKSLKAMVPFEVSAEVLAAVKQVLVKRIILEAPEVRESLEAYIDEAMEITKTVEDRLGGLDKPKFERVLRGIFEEDEPTLIAVGGVLGGCIGLVQGMLVLAL